MSDARSELLALLPAGLVEAVEAATGARIVSARPRGGGGASREGAELDLIWPDGRQQRAYMNHDVHRAGAGDDRAFLREAAVLRAFSGPLAHAGVRVAPFIAALPPQRALLGGFVAGEANFNALETPEARLAVARDYMGQLAKLHAIDPCRTPIEGMGPVERPQAVIQARLAELRTRNDGQRWDPLIHLALEWLEANMPTDTGEPAIVHGDAGPANFLFDQDKVSILLDWELAHYGDPMADLAMLCLRMLFQPFVPLPQAFSAYEAAGGRPVDLQRVRYWRMLFQTGFASRARLDDRDAPPPPNLGMNMVYTTVHRRVLGEALAEAIGIAPVRVNLPDVPEGPRSRSFAIALEDIRTVIAPRCADQQAAVKARGLARLIKWWRNIERYEPALLANECAEINALLGTCHREHAMAWTAFCHAVRMGSVEPTSAVRLCQAHVSREAALMADSMGALADAGFAALE